MCCVMCLCVCLCVHVYVCVFNHVTLSILHYISFASKVGKRNVGQIVINELTSS